MLVRLKPKMMHRQKERRKQSQLLFVHHMMIQLYLCRTVDVQTHAAIEGSHKVTNWILPFLHIYG